MTGLSIGQLAAMAEVNASTLRYYEPEDLVIMPGQDRKKRALVRKGQYQK